MKSNLKKSLIFIDVDGTIYVPELGHIDPELEKTIRKARKKGHLLFLATGRASSFLPPGLFPSLFDGYVLAHGEQVLYHDAIIYSQLLPEDILKNLIDTFNEYNIDYVCYSKDNIYFNRFDSDLYQFLKTQGVDTDNFELLDDEFPISNIYRIEAWDKEGFDWDQFFRSYPSLKWTPDPESLRIDINLKEAKKSLGIEKILEHFDSDAYQTVCFGNALNDSDMFELVDLPIAVENGDPELKKRAKVIAPSVLNNGVGQILEKYFT